MALVKKCRLLVLLEFLGRLGLVLEFLGRLELVLVELGLVLVECRLVPVLELSY